MLLALKNAIDALLKSALPDVFTGAGAASTSFAAETWDFDPLSADPVAGEPGPEDAVDDVPFDPAAPAGPYALTRMPYPGPKRVYLRGADGELVPLSAAEVVWSATDPTSFTLAPRAGRDLAGFSQLEILYGVVASATRLKTLNKSTLAITAADDAAADKALALALAVLALNRAALMARGAFAWSSGGYQAEGVVKTLKLTAGAAPAATARTLSLEAQIDVRLERVLDENEGKPIAHVLSPGKPAGSQPVDVDPILQI